jgi:uncharacterized membrane protein AbrB (regulator of aidB expression)
MSRPALPPARAVVYWSAIAVSVLLTGWALRALRAPSPPLFAGVVIGLVAAVSLPSPRALPGSMRMLSLALVGVGAGALVDRTVLAEAARRPLAILAGVVGPSRSRWSPARYSGCRATSTVRPRCWPRSQAGHPA